MDTVIFWATWDQAISRHIWRGWWGQFWVHIRRVGHYALYLIH